MIQPEQAMARLEWVFALILQEQMAGIPILNERLRVQTVGFQIHQGRCIGVLITPWMMSLVIFPGEGEAWDDLKLGSKQEFKFPSKSLRCMVNRVEDMGSYHSYSLYSPMREFRSQEHAVAAAESFLAGLMVEVEHPDQDPYDEELLGRILRGEEFTKPDEVEPMKPNTTELEANGIDVSLSRRALLRGNFFKSDQEG